MGDEKTVFELADEIMLELTATRAKMVVLQRKLKALESAAAAIGTPKTKKPKSPTAPRQRLVGGTHPRRHEEVGAPLPEDRWRLPTDRAFDRQMSFNGPMAQSGRERGDLTDLRQRVEEQRRRAGAGNAQDPALDGLIRMSAESTVNRMGLEPVSKHDALAELENALAEVDAPAVPALARPEKVRPALSAANKDAAKAMLADALSDT